MTYMQYEKKYKVSQEITL